jgi:hypothetical protein
MRWTRTVRRAVRRAASASVAVLALAAAWRVLQGIGPPPVPAGEAAGLNVQRLVPLSVLTTLKVQVADVQVTRLAGRAGSVEAVLVLRGEIEVGVDLSRARFERVDESAKAAVLVLPAPAVQSVRLDHEHTRLAALWQSGLWTLVPGGEEAQAAAVNLAYRDGQRRLAELAAGPQLLAAARRQAERVLGVFVGELGWKARVRWANGPGSTARSGGPAG